MMIRGVVKLTSGKTVKYNLKPRYQGKYNVCFVDPSGDRVERATGEKQISRAHNEAQIKIVECYQTPADKLIDWDTANELVKNAMRAQNLREDTTVDHYDTVVNLLRAAFPSCKGPTEITEQLALRFKSMRMLKVCPRTVQGNLDDLRTLYKKWYGKTLHLVSNNPFENVESPKVDKKKPRVISDKENQEWHDWLESQYPKWRLPHLFLEVKAAIGCRIGELSKARSDGLKDGRITFLSNATKGRRERSALLPKRLFKELKTVAGPTYIFEGFSDQLRERYKLRPVLPFTPKQLGTFLQRRLRQYRLENPRVKYWKLHNYRSTAASRAHALQIPASDAAIALGLDERTMKVHYTALDEVKIADRVFKQIQQSSGTKVGQNGSHKKK
jgi:hypothetical protein